MKAEIIAVGSELLTPDRLDTNSLFLTEELNKLGIEVVRKTIVGDNRELLAEAFRDALRRVPVFAIRAVDTLGAGDALHAGFALALAEGQSEVAALRFGAAVAGIKCSRFGGSAGTPSRPEVEALLGGRNLATDHSRVSGHPVAGSPLSRSRGRADD